jgi:hypothetical protein
VVAVATQAGAEVVKHNTGKSDKMSVRCKENRCTFRVNARAVDKKALDGSWSFTLVELDHTCDGTAKRRRSYHATAIQEIQADLAPFVPTGTKSDVPQLQKLMRKLGFDVGDTVARKAVEGLLGRDRLSFFRQFALLPDYAEAVNAGDPAGRFIVEMTSVEGDNRFISAYMALGYSKSIWAHLRHNCSVDGAGVRTIIEGTLLAAVTLSANDELILLAIQYCGSEDKDGCVVFSRRLEEDFPGITLIFQDAGASLISACEAVSIKWRRCVQHLGKNVTSKFSGTPNELIEQLYGLARATTSTIFKAGVEKMRADFPKNRGAIDYIVATEHTFVAYHFIHEKLRSFGQTTNNPVEQAWQFLRAVRKLPVISMFQTVRELFCSKLQKQLELATKHASMTGIYNGDGNRNKIVPVVIKKLENAVSRLKTKDVTISSINAHELNGSVQLSRSVSATVTLTKDGSKDTSGLSFGVRCSHCCAWFDNGYLCDCAVALVAAASANKRYGSFWSVYGTEFVHKHRTTRVWMLQSQGKFPLIAFTTTIPPTVDNCLLPWRFPPKKPGRKKKRSAKEKAEGTREYLCAGCGKNGHGLASCENKDLDRVRCVWEERAKSIKPKAKRSRLPVSVVDDTLRDADEGQGFSSGDESSHAQPSDDIAPGEENDFFMQSYDGSGEFGSDEQAPVYLDGEVEVGEAMQDLEDEWPGMQAQVEASRRSHAQILAASRLVKERAAEYGLLEQPGIAADGNCFFDAVIDQIRLRVAQTAKCPMHTIHELRLACVDLIFAEYGHTSPDGLIARGLETSWADWKAKMSQNKYFADELCLEAVETIYDTKLIVVGSNGTDVSVTSWGSLARENAIWLGCMYDNHFMSLVEPSMSRDANARATELQARAFAVRTNIFPANFKWPPMADEVEEL